MKLFNNGLGRIISFMSLILVLILTFFISLEFLTPTAINVSAHSILTEGSFTSYHGSTSVTYKDAAMVLKSHSNPGTVFFAEREFDDYEMEVEFQLNSGSWFGIMYRAHGAEKGFYQLGPGANGRHQLNRHTTKA